MAIRPAAVHSAKVYDRSYFLATGVVVYLALAALQHAPGERGPLLVLGASPFVLAAVWARTRASLHAASEVHPSALVALRICACGGLAWLAAISGGAGKIGFELAVCAALGSSCVAAAWALARIPHRGGLVTQPASTQVLDAAIAGALFWGIAAAVPASRHLLADPSLLAALSSRDGFAAAAVASHLVLSAAALRVRLRRQLELGVPERAWAALVLSASAASVAIAVAAAGVLASDRALALGSLGAAVGCAWAATHPDPVRLTRSVRAALALLAIAVPVALALGAHAQRHSLIASGIVLGASAFGVALGLAARAGARPFAAEPSRRLSALERAGQVAFQPDPEAALVAALAHLGTLEANGRARTELWRLDPPEVSSVDVAGYLHRDRGSAPEVVYELARSEPERLLRADVLAALEVRRPEVRPALQWLEAREAVSATLVCDDHGRMGLLLLPKGSRSEAPSLAEARAARQLADRLAAVLGMSTSLARAREREQQARNEANAARERLQRLETSLTARGQRRDQLAEVLAARVRAAVYGPRARGALDELYRLARLEADVTFEVPVGSDALGWACVHHVAGPRRAGPLVVVNGSTTSSHASGYLGSGPEAALERARGGTLVLLNVACLPPAVQDELAADLARRAPEPALAAAPAVVVATINASIDACVEARQLSPALARVLLRKRLRLPPLGERPEDLRALILDRICASGARALGAPLGVEPAALALLTTHDWPGNDAELEALVQRVCRLARGERISIAELAAAGFMPAVVATVPPAWETCGAASAERESYRARATRVSDVVAVAEPNDSEPAAATGQGDAAPVRSTPRRRRRR